MVLCCGACGKQMKYTEPLLTCSGKGCKSMAHYACAASTKQDWRCVGCCYPTEISVQYLLGEILKRGSGLELLHGLIGKINDLLTDINAIKDENESLKQEISLLTCAKVMNIPINLNKQLTETTIPTVDLISSEQIVSSQKSHTTVEQQQQHVVQHNQQQHVVQHNEQQHVVIPRKISIFVSWSNTTETEIYLKEYLQRKTQITGIECIRVSCYDAYSMFQIKVDQCDAHIFTNSDVYPKGCKLEVYSR